MVFLCEHKVVGDSQRVRPRQNDREGEQGVHRTKTANVQIDVDTTVVIQDEVTDSISALDRIRVAVEGLEEPGVLLRDELARGNVSPESVLAVDDANECGKAEAAVRKAWID